MEDRYHATAVESGEQLMRCCVYIDLNPLPRQERWTKDLAVGNRAFVESFGKKAGLNTKRRMRETDEGLEIREKSLVFGKMAIEEKVLWSNNTFLWNAQEPENP